MYSGQARIIGVVAFLSTLGGLQCMADPPPTQGDGVRFPLNSVVYTIKDFEIPNERGASHLGPSRDPFLNMYHRCNAPLTAASCLASLQWFNGCVISQSNPITTSGPSIVDLRLVVSGEAYKLTSLPAAVMWDPFFKVRVSYVINGQPTELWESYPLAYLPRKFMMRDSNNIAYFDDVQEHDAQLKKLSRFTIPQEADDIRVSICDVAPGVLQIHELEISTQLID